MDALPDGSHPQPPLLTCSVPVRSDSPLQQGDLIEHSALQNVEEAKTLMILTADCDIANGKFGNSLLCCEVLTADNYIFKTWYPRWVKKNLEKYLNKRSDKCAKVTADRFIQWASESSNDEIREALGLNENEWSRDRKSVNFARASKLEPTTRDELVAAILVAIGSEDKAAANKEVVKVFQSALPGDVAPLPDPFRDSEPRFVDLRRLHNVEIGDIAREPLSRNVKQFVRVGRLADRYIFSISKKFADTYSRIGLPDDDQDYLEYYGQEEWGSTR
ncbi:hypothetical protein [Micrococcus luteus]|uniref:hypothetical protein n=1 Tax=Micrococcus luteus TaxID=1270 RepID=UPI0011A79C9B|nr:hypothetical protein [Micrococcus luteus]